MTYRAGDRFAIPSLAALRADLGLASASKAGLYRPSYCQMWRLECHGTSTSVIVTQKPILLGVILDTTLYMYPETGSRCQYVRFYASAT